MFVYPNLRGEFRINLGIAALMSYLKQNTTHEVDLIDVTFHRRSWHKYILKKLGKFHPDVIAVSVLTYNFYDSLQIVHYMKKFYPNAFVVYGGVHTSLFPLDSLRHKFVDAIVIGDGEYTFEKVLFALESKKGLGGIPGVYYKSKGKILKNAKPHFIEDLDALPFLDCSFFELEKYNLVNPYEITMLGSRGCPFNCTFCINPVLAQMGEGQYVRWRSPENIIKEMQYHSKTLNPRKFRYFYLWDDMFNLKPAFVQQFCDLFQKTGLSQHYSWSCSSRADTLDESRVNKLAESNLNLTRIGIEAGNTNIRNEVYCKNISVPQILNAMRMCHQYNIKTQTDFIIGGPKETKRTILQTYYLMQIIKPTQISLSIFQPFPLLKATELFLTEGGMINRKDWQHVSTFFNQPSIHGTLSRRFLQSIKTQLNLIYVIHTVFIYLKQEKIRFLYDTLKFLSYLKWRYKLLWHDLFKYTIRKYIYEDNLHNISKP